jgi:hypothetical protein
MRGTPKTDAIKVRVARTDTEPSFVDKVRAQHFVERLNRGTGTCALISIDEAVCELDGCHQEPLELLIQRVVLPTPWAYYRLHLPGSSIN